ncbi:MAG: leucine-rich repeat domain-containing protein [Oscillospiraceae bacterium]|nr:leucine-rich repeat domain-containing protein [Oscillospiraceae bacterium]
MRKKNTLGLTLLIVLCVVGICVCLGIYVTTMLPSGSFGFGRSQVTLGGREFPADTSNIRAVITADEVAALDQFSSLKAADLRGSDCYAELAAWAAAHPEVEVLYSVTFPNGETVESTVSALDLSWVTDAQLDTVARQLACLPAVEQIQLGTLDGVRVDMTHLQTLFAASPHADFDFIFSIGGQMYDTATTSVDLQGLSREDIAAAAVILPIMKQLGQVELGSQDDPMNQLTWADIAQLKSSCPNAHFSYRFTLYGREVDLDTEELDYRGVAVGDDGDALFEILPCMNNCKLLDMDSTGVSDARMAQLRDLCPQTKVVWRIWFGELYSVRTDAERVLASKPSVGGMIYDASPLQYCTEMKYLDLGHNEDLSDLSFAANMPQLEVLIIAMTAITDISPLQNCDKLEYLELNSTNVADLSPLEGHTALRHLNIASCPKIRDISPLYSIPELERLWIGVETPVPSEQVDAMRAAAPACKVNTTTYDPHGDAWRFTRYDPEEPKYWWVPRYELLRNQLGYNYQEYSFYWLDPLCDLEAPPQYRGMFGKEVYGL